MYSYFKHRFPAFLRALETVPNDNTTDFVDEITCGFDFVSAFWKGKEYPKAEEWRACVVSLICFCAIHLHELCIKSTKVRTTLNFSLDFTI